MAVHLISFLKEQFTPAVVDQLSATLNESPANTLKAINGSLPTLLGGLARRVQSSGGASSVIRFLDKGDYGNTPLDVSQAVQQHDVDVSGNSRDFLNELFDDQLPRVTELISTYSGTKPQSTQTILSLAASVLMGILGRQEQEKGLTAESLTTLVGGQATELRKSLPGGLEAVGSLLGFDELVTPTGPPTLVQGEDNFTSTPVNPNIPKSAEGDREKENKRWMGWALIAIAVLVLGLLVQKCRENQNSIDGVSTDSTSRIESNAVEDTSAATKRSVEEAHGEVGDTTVPGPLGIRDSSTVKP